MTSGLNFASGKEQALHSQLLCVVAILKRKVNFNDAANKCGRRAVEPGKPLWKNEVTKAQNIFCVNGVFLDLYTKDTYGN